MSTTVTPTPTAVARRTSPASTALGIALLSAAAFGTSGPFAKALLDAGWSPSAAVTARIGIGALVLVWPTARALRGRWHLLRQRWAIIVFFALTGVAGTQLAYFYAVQYISVGVALLLEYLSPLLLIGLFWIRHRRSPGRMTLAGAALCMGGLVLVLDVFSGVQMSLVGVAWGLLAACCSAGHRTSVLVPVLWIALISAALAYLTGVVASRRLGSRVASFVALSEVLFAIVSAWLLVDQMPLPIQLAGGVLIVAGVVLVKLAPSHLAD